MEVGIMDADLIYRRRHRFPNFVCMKLAGYHKQIGNKVVLHTRKDVSPADSYDLLYVAIERLLKCLRKLMIKHDEEKGPKKGHLPRLRKGV